MMLDNQWTVVDMNIDQSLIETTQGGDWGFDENGKMWIDPPDLYRKYIPGVRTVTMTLMLNGQPTGPLPQVNENVVVADA